jgi:hydroxymethylpyrimidine pyrophosphatase-like HAD family hydrolase
MDEVMACGDAGNDTMMIKAAGTGVVMGNGREELKAIADFVTKTNDEDGVAYAIEKLVLNS